MKLVKFLLVALFILVPIALFSQTVLLDETFSSPASLSGWWATAGDWKVMKGRLYQTDTKETMAMITIPVRQSGTMLYEFDLRYVAGGEDDYAGFGIHICVNNPSRVRSWGNGRSLLGWITWDPKTYGYPGAFIQVYESKSLTNMGLYTKIFPGSDPIAYGDMLPVREEYLKYEYLDATVPIKILINLDTGEGRFYDPLDPDKYYYSFYLGGPVKPGNYFSFRVNSVSLSLDNLKITKIK